MAGAFTTDLLRIQAAEATADYAGVGSFKAAIAVNDDFKLESTFCITYAASSGTGTGHAEPFAIVRAVSAAAVSAGGSGYVVGEILTVVGGTGIAAQLTVATLSGSAVATVTVPVLTSGSYTTSPTNPVSTTSNLSGTGATFNLTIGGINLSGQGIHVFQWAKEIAWPSTAQKVFGGLGLVISSDAPPTVIIAVNSIGLDTILAANAPTATITIAASGRTFTRSAGSFLDDGFLEGKVITTTGFLNPGNNVSGAVIQTLTATVITVTTATTSLVDETGNANERVQAFPALDSKNGITQSGTGYAVNDVLTITGGTGTAATFTVTAVTTLDTGAGGITINVVAASGTFTRTTGDLLTDGFYPGRTIVTSGFTNGGNNVTKVTRNVTATVITVSNITGLVDENGNGDERVLSTNGVTAVSKTTSSLYTVFPTMTAVTGVATTVSPNNGTDCRLWLLRVHAVTNSKHWYLGGNNTESIRGWTPYVVDVDGTPDLSIGTPDMTSIDRIGTRSMIIAVATLAHTILDISRFGTGSTISAGTGRSPVTMADYQAYDNASNLQLGVVIVQNGIYFIGGKLNFGTTTQSAETVFKDTNLVAVYQDFPVASGFYEIKVVGASGQKTTFQLGNYTPASNLTSAGCTIKGSGNISGTARLDGVEGMAHSSWKLTASDANQVTKLYNCTFSEMLSAALAYNAVSIELTTNCTTNTTTTLTTTGDFDTSGIVIGMKVTGTNIPSNTYVSSIQSATSLTMDKAATGSGSSLTMTFTHNNEMRGCTFSNSGTVTTNGCVIDNCTFQDIKTGAPISATYALIIASSTEGNRITNSKFINCNRAIKISASGTYTFDNLTFSGNTYDIENAATSGTITVNAINGSNPGTYNYINTGGVFGTLSCKSFNANTSAYTDETTDINNATANDVALPPIQNTTAGDIIYFGDAATFTGVALNVGTAGAHTGITINWEYWNGSSWTAITTVVDETTSFKTAGTNTINFSAPTDWATTSVDGTTKYWIRARDTRSSPAYTTTPLGTQGFLGSTVINNAVTLEVNGVTSGARCYIEVTGGGDTIGRVLMSEEANSSGIATESYNYPGSEVNVKVKVRLVGFLPFETTGVIDANGLTTTAVWQQDTISDRVETT